MEEYYIEIVGGICDELFTNRHYYLYKTINNVLDNEYISINYEDNSLDHTYLPVQGLHKIDKNLYEMLLSEDQEIVNVAVELIHNEIMAKRPNEKPFVIRQDDEV